MLRATTMDRDDRSEEKDLADFADQRRKTKLRRNISKQIRRKYKCNPHRLASVSIGSTKIQADMLAQLKSAAIRHAKMSGSASSHALFWFRTGQHGTESGCYASMTHAGDVHISPSAAGLVAFLKKLPESTQNEIAEAFPPYIGTFTLTARSQRSKHERENMEDDSTKAAVGAVLDFAWRAKTGCHEAAQKFAEE